MASVGSEFSAAAVREAIGMAHKCGARVHVMALVATGVEHEGLGEAILKQELGMAQAHLEQVRQQAADRIENQYLRELLSKNRGKIGKTAQDAGIGVRQLHKLMRKHNIQKETFKVPSSLQRKEEL